MPWTENQGCWRLLITGSGPDPECAFDDPTERETWGRGPLTAYLRTMSVSDTLVGAWSGGRGPLGQLGHQVRGGFDMETTAERAAGVRAAYAALPSPTGPYWGGGFPKGDARTVIRGDETSGMGLEWMTATEAAYERFCEVADIDPERPHGEMILQIDGVPAEEESLVEQWHGRLSEALPPRPPSPAALPGRRTGRPT